MAGIATAAHWQIAGNGSQDQLHLFRTLRIEGVTVVARRITTRGTLVVKSKRPSASVFAEARSPICSTQASGIGVPRIDNESGDLLQLQQQKALLLSWRQVLPFRRDREDYRHRHCSHPLHPN